MKNTLKDLNINQRNIKKFENLQDCLNFKIIKNIKYKVYYEKYYK